MDELTIDIEKTHFRVCTYPDRFDGGWVGGPIKDSVEKIITELEKKWGMKATIVADYRGILAPKKHIVLTRRRLEERTNKKFTFDVPQDGIITWDPPDDHHPYWHAWLHLKTENAHGYYPSKRELAEVIPILESITGGKWKWDNGLIMYEWSPDERVVKGLYDYEKENNEE